jgi:hypothetical protein
MSARQTAVWDHLRMDPKEDPEARIRELERSLADTARASELGAAPYSGDAFTATPPTYVPPTATPATYVPSSRYDGGSMDPYATPQYSYPQVPRKMSTGFGALPFVIAGIVLAVMLGIGAVVFFSVRSSIPGGLTSIPSIPSISIPSFPSVEPPRTPGGSASTVQVPPPGGSQSVSGVGENKTVVCNDSAVSISGVTNTVTITGHCTKVTVSGMQNHVTLDTANAIGASGFDNVVTYHSGSPDIDSGGSNVVQQG